MVPAGPGQALKAIDDIRDAKPGVDRSCHQPESSAVERHAARLAEEAGNSARHGAPSDRLSLEKLRKGGRIEPSSATGLLVAAGAAGLLGVH